MPVEVILPKVDMDMETGTIEAWHVKEGDQVRQGETIFEIGTNKAVMEALGGLPPVKVHCSLLAEQAVHAALWDYAQKNHITIEGLKPPVNDVDELEEAHKDEA